MFRRKRKKELEVVQMKPKKNQYCRHLDYFGDCVGGHGDCLPHPCLSIRTSNLENLGSRSVDTGRGIAASLKRFALTDIRGLIENRQVDDTYRSLCEYLGEIRDVNGYKYLYVIYKEDDGYRVLLDAQYSPSLIVIPIISKLGSYLPREISGRPPGS